MRHVAVLVILGLVGGAIGTLLDRDVNINIYDVFRSLQVGLPLRYYIDHLKNGEFHFTDKIFRYYPDNITDFVVAFKNGDTDYTLGYYVRTGDFPTIVGDRFEDVKPLYDYLNNADFFALTPLAAQKFAPDYFTAPFKYLHYQYIPNADLTKQVPLVFLIPRTYFKEGALESLLLIGEYKIQRDGVHATGQYRGARNTRTPADPAITEAYGEPTEHITHVAPPVIYSSPQGFRHINTYRYQLPNFSVDPYEYFFEKKYSYNPYYSSFGKSFGSYYPYESYSPYYEIPGKVFDSYYPYESYNP